MSTDFKLYEITGKPLDFGVFVKWTIKKNPLKTKKEVFEKCDELHSRYNICTRESYERSVDYDQNVRFLLQERTPEDLVIEIILAEKLKNLRILRSKK
jgi:hypothetical protein